VQPPTVVDEHAVHVDDQPYAWPGKRMGAVFRLRSGSDSWYYETKRMAVKYDHVVVQVSCNKPATKVD
jgi:hypothetical protein